MNDKNQPKTTFSNEYLDMNVNINLIDTFKFFYNIDKIFHSDNYMISRTTLQMKKMIYTANTLEQMDFIKSQTKHKELRSDFDKSGLIQNNNIIQRRKTYSLTDEGREFFWSIEEFMAEPDQYSIDTNQNITNKYDLKKVFLIAFDRWQNEKVKDEAIMHKVKDVVGDKDALEFRVMAKKEGEKYNSGLNQNDNQYQKP